MDRKNKFGNMFLKFIGNKIKFQEDFPKRQCKSIQNAPISESAIGQHLLDQDGPTSAFLWATFQNYSSLRASTG